MSAAGHRSRPSLAKSKHRVDYPGAGHRCFEILAIAPQQSVGSVLARKFSRGLFSPSSSERIQTHDFDNLCWRGLQKASHMPVAFVVVCSTDANRRPVVNHYPECCAHQASDMAEIERRASFDHQPLAVI